MITVTPSGQACGAAVTGIDLSKPLDLDQIAAIRSAWLEHHVLAFPDQDLSDDDLERFTLYFGPFGDDPFIAPVEGRKHIIAIERAADEQAPVFAEVWHTDWSFQAFPPDGTCLYGIKIPPVGGDTLFINQHKVLAEMPDTLRQKLDGLIAIHSARGGYSKEGAYGENETTEKMTMTFLPSDDAKATQTHPLIRPHPETGQLCIFGAIGYIIGIEGMDEDTARALLLELYQLQTQEQFQYRHKWQAGTLLMWDNRSVLHSASSGYDGHHRLLHRTTIGCHNRPDKAA